MIKLIIYIILGLIQGFTEPLPISSSGHLTLFKMVFNTTLFNNIEFLTLLNFASFIAILIIYYKDIKLLLKNSFYFIIDKKNNKQYKNEFNYVIKIIISSIPTFIIGIIFKNMIDKNLSNITVITLAFIVTAIILFIANFKNGNKNINDITIKKALIIGVFQAIALLPGISRSGTVMAGLLLLNIKKDDAIKYTFMLYFPVSLASIIIDIPYLFNIDNSTLILYSISFLVTLIITYFSYQWLVKLVKNNKLWYFSLYCILLALFIIIYFH